MRHLLNRCGLIVHIAVAGLFATALATFGWAIARTVQFVIDLLSGSWDEALLVVDLLEVIDTYLIAIVQIIVVIGLYELFVGDLDVPDWLEARSLDDLKKSLVDVLIVVLAVKGIEKLISAKRPVDALYYAAAVAVMVVAFTLFRSSKTVATKLGATKPSALAPALTATTATPEHE
jgi:uncharacterized membrane protein YqhA